MIAAACMNIVRSMPANGHGAKKLVTGYVRRNRQRSKESAW
jgi:hypothetical protein